MKLNNENHWILYENNILRELINNYSNLKGKIKINTLDRLLINIKSDLILSLFYIYNKFLSKKNIKDVKFNLVFLIPEGQILNNSNIYLKNKNNIININAYKKNDILSLVNLSLKDILKQNKIIKKITNSFFYENKFSHKFIKLLKKNLERRIANYVIMSAIFNKLKKKYGIKNINVHTFGSPFIASASIYQKINTIYYAHGLLGKNYFQILPNYDEIYVCSNFEKNYLRNLLNKKNIYSYNYEKIKNHKNNIIIFTRKNMQINDYIDLNNIINFFIKNKFNIYLKNHPQSENNILYDYIENYSKLKFVSKNSNSINILKNFKPKFTIQWFSTTSAESLYSNILPISLANFEEIRKKNIDVLTIDWLIYPIKDKVLSWHKEKNIISRIMNDTSEYTEIINILKKKYE